MWLKVEDWVESSPPDKLRFRQAVHLILKAIADSEELQPEMIMKGGMLLGIRYGSKRYTKDIDFSTGRKFTADEIPRLESQLNAQLDVAEAELNYGLKCQFQSYQVQPSANGTFPTVQIKIAYVAKDNAAQLNRLKKKEVSSVISIDYSFNEQTYHKEILELGDEHSKIQAYALIDVLAEKFRAVLQQKVRGRNREQDIYDLNFLIKKTQPLTSEEAFQLIETLIKKSEGKEISELLCAQGIRDPEIKLRSGERYLDLKDTVEELPDFESSYECVAQFFEALPWELFTSTYQ